MSRKLVRTKGLLTGILMLVIVLIVFLLLKVGLSSSGKEAAEVVIEFYQYEQKGEFASSWALFHSTMKEKFPKGHYIQDRAHVFMNHFGVETFTFTIGETEEFEKWKLSKDGPEFQNVYLVPVTQTYKGKYGNFDLEQKVFAVEEKGKWKILWDYNR
nr:hypothetical protein [Neobacillus sp. Marseille-Q6967]